MEKRLYDSSPKVTHTGDNGDSSRTMYGGRDMYNIHNEYHQSTENNQQSSHEHMVRGYHVVQNVCNYFTGRNDELEVIHKAFFDNKPQDGYTRRFVVYGMPGSGKTQLCLKFAYEHRERREEHAYTSPLSVTSEVKSFWTVFHIDGSTKLAADASFASIAQKSNRKPDKDEGIDYLANTSRRWLLIIDNVDSSEVKIEDYCPQSRVGCVLITTRNPELTQFANAGSLQIDRMPREDGKRLLLVAAKKPVNDEKYDRLATEIIDELDYLALAINQAGVAICRGIPMEEYLDTYARTFHPPKKINGVHSWETQTSSIQTTFELLRKRIEDIGTCQSFRACEILDVAGMYHYRRIPKALFLDTSPSVWEPYIDQGRFKKFTTQALSVASQFLSVFEDSSIPNRLKRYLGDSEDLHIPAKRYDDMVSVHQAFLLLNEYSLIDFEEDGKSFSMHGVVHQWVRDRLGEEQVHTRQVAAAGLVNAIAGQTERDIIDMDFRRSLLPHVAFFLSSSSFPSSVPPPSPWMENLEDSVPSRHLNQYQSYAAENLAIVFAENGLNSQAGDLRYEVLRGLEKTRGRQDQHTLAVADNLGVILAKQSEYHIAEELHERAIEGRKKYLGENHGLVLESQGNLAVTLNNKGEHRRAEDLHRQLLEKKRQLICSDSSKDPATIIDSKSNLALCLNQQSKYGEAIGLLQETLGWREENLGNYHLDTIENLADLAAAYANEGSHALAIKMYEDSLRRRRHVLGELHPETMMNKSALAWMFSQNKDLEKAGRLSEEACLSLKAHSGRAQSYAPMILGYHARIQSKLKRFQDAAELASEALEAFEHDGVDSTNPDVLSLMVNMGLISRKQDKLDDAEKMYRMALYGYRQLPDQPNKDTMICLSNLAVVLERKDCHEEAADKHLEALTNLLKLLPKHHPQTLQCMGNYVRFWKKQGGYSTVTSTNGIKRSRSPSHMLEFEEPALRRIKQE